MRETTPDPGCVLHYRGSFASGSAFMLSLVVNGSPHVCRSPTATIADLVRDRRGLVLFYFPKANTDG